MEFLGSLSNIGSILLTALGLGLVIFIHELGHFAVANPQARIAGTGLEAVAVFTGGWAIQQLWLFWVAPIVGGIIGAVVHKALISED